MYLPDAFRAKDLRDLDRLVARNAFGTLVSTFDGAPFASHLPVLYRRTGEEVVLAGHWARANPQWRGIETQRALFIFHGPHAYISPRWYLDPQRQVPTWNYAVAHIYGRVRVISDPEQIEPIVTALAARYESQAAAPWRLETTGATGRERLKAIVGFELTADELQVKLKLGQNQPAGNVRGAIEGLHAAGSEEAVELADWMQESLEHR